MHESDRSSFGGCGVGAGPNVQAANGEMTCVICRYGETQPGRKTGAREGVVAVFTRVPAEICADCGEASMDEPATERLLEIFEDAVRAGVKVGVREYDAISSLTVPSCIRSRVGFPLGRSPCRTVRRARLLR